MERIALTGFRGLQNYTTLKQNHMGIRSIYCFRGLQNYTTLKPLANWLAPLFSFRGLQNYTTLKQQGLQRNT